MKEVTFQLILKVKERTEEFLCDLKEELHKLGIRSYSEGSLDNLDALDLEECEKMKEDLLSDNYVAEAIFIHSYSKETLSNYFDILKAKFGSKVDGEFSEMKTTDWRDKWRESFKPIETKSFRVCPPWNEETAPGKKQITIEPALAFGTGQHETTQLCLSLIEEYTEGQSKLDSLNVLDLGTGSGILAIAAAKEGIQNIEALDIDEDSVKAAKTNAELNGVEFEAAKSDLRSYLPQRKFSKYDLVLANILLPVLLQSLPDMAEVTPKGGELILSGLIVSQKEEMLEACKKFGFELISEKVKADWLGLRVKKK